MENKRTKAGIWNSVPDLDGSNGALKALARNVANHLKLNPPEMKRVVAQVVADRHGHGDVADYKGHMYYVKPDRIDMTQLITQSKEAFDEMMQQQREQKQKVQSPKKVRSLGNANKKNPNLTKKSSTAVFEIENWGRKSLNGVIIDETHLPRGDKEILLAVNRRIGPTDGGLKKMKKKPKAFAAVPVAVPSPKAEKKNVPVKAPGIKEPPPIALRQTVIKRLHTKAPVRVPKKTQPLKSLPDGESTSPILKNEPYRLPAGSSYHPPMGKTNDLIAKKSLNRSKSKTSTLRKPMQRSRNYDKPWLVRRSKCNRSKPAGQPDELRPIQSQSRKLPVPKSRSPVTGRQQQNRVNFGWQTPYQIQGGAGATTQKANENPSKFNLQKVKSVPKTKTKSKSKAKLSQGPQGARKETPQNRRSQLNKMIQARLIKDLLREEAIDEPERLEAGSIRSTRVKKQREKKQNNDTPQNREEAIIEVCCEKSMTNQDDNPMKTKSKLKMKPKVKPAKSTRIKRIPKKSIPSILASPKAAFTPAIPQNLSQMLSPRSKQRQATQRTQRPPRRVPVGSSLGSIGLMRWNKHNVGTSTSILTPAKRHLTIAFMNKRLEERNQRQIAVPWK